MSNDIRCDDSNSNYFYNIISGYDAGKNLAENEVWAMVSGRIVLQ
jgi:hypothetical protein